MTVSFTDQGRIFAWRHSLPPIDCRSVHSQASSRERRSRARAPPKACSPSAALSREERSPRPTVCYACLAQHIMPQPTSSGTNSQGNSVRHEKLLPHCAYTPITRRRTRARCRACSTLRTTTVGTRTTTPPASRTTTPARTTIPRRATRVASTPKTAARAVVATRTTRTGVPLRA